MNAVSPSMKAEVIGFQTLILHADVAFVVEQVLHTHCWIFHVCESSSVLLKRTAQYLSVLLPETWETLERVFSYGKEITCWK